MWGQLLLRGRILALLAQASLKLGSPCSSREGTSKDRAFLLRKTRARCLRGWEPGPGARGPQMFPMQEVGA